MVREAWGIRGGVSTNLHAESPHVPAHHWRRSILLHGHLHPPPLTRWGRKTSAWHGKPARKDASRSYWGCVSFLAGTKSTMNLCFTMPATFIFTKFAPNKLNNYLHYAHHGGAVCRGSGIAMANQPTPPPGASAEGVRRGRCARVLFNLADRPRKKIITKLNDLFYVFTPYPTYNAPKTMA